jgi:hypothetical protein
VQFDDEGSRLLEGQWQETQFLGKFPGSSFIAGLVTFFSDPILEVTRSIIR